MNRRRRWIISRTQARLVAINLAYASLLVLAFSAAILLPLVLKIEDPSLSPEEQERIARQLLTIHTHIWPGVVMVFAAFALHSVRLTHRIVGPLYRFTETLRSMAGGDISMQVKIRPRDLLADEAAVFNAALSGLRARVGAVDAQARQLGERIEGLSAALARGEVELLEQGLHELGEDVVELERALRAIETGRREGVASMSAPAPEPALPETARAEVAAKREGDAPAA